MVFNNKVCLQWGFIAKGVEHRTITLPTSYISQYQICLQGYDTSTRQNYPVISKTNNSSWIAHWHNNVGTGGWISIGF